MRDTPKATLPVRKDRTPEIWEPINDVISKGHPSRPTFFPLYAEQVTDILECRLISSGFYKNPEKLT